MIVEKNKRKRILYIVGTIFFIICFMIVNVLLTRQIIRKQAVRQLKEVTRQSADDLSTIFKGSVDSIKMSAQLCSTILNQDSNLTYKDMKKIKDASSFSNISYVNDKGNINAVDSNNYLYSNYEFYKMGMNGKSGISIGQLSPEDSENRIIFYAPVVDKDENPIGVLFAYYDNSTMQSMLDKYYYSSYSKTFLCTIDGTIVATNTQNHEEYDTLQDFFVKGNLLSKEESDLIEKALNREDAVTGFTYNENGGESRSEICKVGTTQLYVLETFPSYTFNMLIKEHTTLFFIATLFLSSIFILVCLLIYIKGSEKRKILEKENIRINNIVEGSQKLFTAMGIVNFEKDSYEIIHGNDDYNHSNFPKTGKFSTVNNFFSKIYVEDNKQRPLSMYTNSKWVNENLKGKKDIFSCSYTFGENHEKWGCLYVIPLKNQGNEECDYLFASTNITKLKEVGDIQKQISQLVYGSSFSFVGFIDEKDGSLDIKYNTIWNKSERSMIKTNYEVLKNSTVDDIVIHEQQDEFKIKASLKNIVDALKKDDSYEITVNLFKMNEISGVFKFYYKYYYKNKGIILCAVEDISQKSQYDEVTGLYNIHGFVKKFTEIVANKKDDRKFAMLNFNIEEFKLFNDRYGYTQGDMLLKEVAQRLKNSSMEFLAVERQTEDQFYCLAYEDQVDYDEIEKLCKWISSINDHLVYLSCGIIVFDEVNTSLRAICDKAHLAQQQVGVANKIHSYFIYNEKTKKMYDEQYAVLTSIDKAIDNKNFCVFYQPIYNAKTKKIALAEGLVRWIDPKKGMISPGSFIPALENAGRLSDLDFHMAEMVTKFQTSRVKKGKNTIPISVNLSRYDIANNKIMLKLLDYMDLCKVDPNLICFEVTESALINIPKTQGDNFSRLRDKGYTILIDDFGSGYSSFSSLTERKYDILKLDMSLVSNIHKSETSNEAVVSIIEFAHKLGLEIIAEGVETKEQYDFLLKNNCDYIQGFYFSKPVCESDFEQLLGENMK